MCAVQKTRPSAREKDWISEETEATITMVVIGRVDSVDEMVGVVSVSVDGMTEQVVVFDNDT